MTTSALARHAGLRASAIRYYEAIGLLPRAPRRSGQRVYDSRAIRRLAVVRQAQEAGFTLDEIRVVLQSDSLAEAWNAIAARKLGELDAQIERLHKRQELIKRVQLTCRCHTADECGGVILG